MAIFATVLLTISLMTMNKEDLIQLKVLGITRSEVQPGAYALLLENADSTPELARRIPIVVGAAEAQSIAVYLEQVSPSTWSR